LFCIIQWKGLIDITKTFYWAIWSEVHEDDDWESLSDEQRQEREKETSNEFAKQMNAEHMYMFRMESKRIINKRGRPPKKKAEPTQEVSAT